jgi:hypothetical protein
MRSGRQAGQGSPVAHKMCRFEVGKNVTILAMSVKKKSKAVRDPEKASTDVHCFGRRMSPAAREIGGRKQGLEPTRYGDWEKNGRCIDF